MNRLSEEDHLCPFKEHWLDSSFQETLLPNAPWYMIQEVICNGLVKKMKSQLRFPERRQMIFELLGPEFVMNNCPEYEQNPTIIRPPKMSIEKRLDLQVEASGWLHHNLIAIATQAGYRTMDNEGGHIPDDLRVFYDHTRQVFQSNLDRTLYLQENKLLKEKIDNEIKEMEQEKELKEKQKKLHSILSSATSHGTSSSAMTEQAVPSTGQLRESVHRLTGDPPQFSGPQSDTIGHALVKILQHDPRRIPDVTTRLKGQVLPSTLRTFIWLDVLFTRKRKQMPGLNSEQVVRERFGKAVARGVGDMKLKRATHSPINSLIENAVIEFYESTPSLMAYNKNIHMKETSRVMNVLYVYSRAYEPYFIYWQHPLQLAFRGRHDDITLSAEHVYELSMYLDLLVNDCLLSWKEVFSCAEKVMHRLKMADMELCNHMNLISKRNYRIQAKDFLVHLVNLERAQTGARTASGTSPHLSTRSHYTPGSVHSHHSAGLYPVDHSPGGATGSRQSAEHNLASHEPTHSKYSSRVTEHSPGSRVSGSSRHDNHESLADPVLFLRKWIGEVFVSVLDTATVMFVWDQCFMQHWDSSVLEDVAVAVLLLLRHTFMQATDFPTIKKVFMKEPCKLYTKDVQRAWLHLQNGGDPGDIPDMNRHNIKPVMPKRRVYTPPHLHRDNNSLLKAVGLRDIKILLVFPEDIVETNPWLASLQPERLLLDSSIYFGGTKLTENTGQHAPRISQITDTEDLTYKLEYPLDVFVHEGIDIRSVEGEGGASVHGVIQLQYSLDRPHSVISDTNRDSQEHYSTEVIALGWADVHLYDNTEDHTDTQTWVVKEQEVIIRLRPGRYSGDNDLDNASVSVDIPYNEDIIADKTQISLLVFDPIKQNTPISDSTPVPAMSRVTSRLSIPPDRTIATPENIPGWVEYKPLAAAKNPKPSSNIEPFDLYIDGVNYIPDNAIIIKITGRMIRTGREEAVPDILAFPEATSSARSPKFTYRLCVDPRGGQFDGHMLAFIRIYTIQLYTGVITIVGSCLVRIFDVISNNQAYLRVGGHQLRMREKAPNIVDGDANLSEETDMDDNLSIPCLSLLVRLLPHKKKAVPAVSYKTGYYQSETCRPTLSEQRIIQSYQNDSDFPKSTEDMARYLYYYEREGSPRNTPDNLQEYASSRLDRSLQPEGFIPEFLDLSGCVHYRMNIGLNVQIKQAFGLPEGSYIQCYVRLHPGEATERLESTPDGADKEYHFTTESHDMSSLQKSPAWTDSERTIHPYYDDKSCLVIRIYGMKATYKPTTSHVEAGPIKGQPRLDLLGWTVVPLFHKHSVKYGMYRVPILKNLPDDDILHQLKTKSVPDVLKSRQWKRNSKYEAASLTVNIWDAHYDVDDCPEFQENSELLPYVGEVVKYRQAMVDVRGLQMNQFILNTLERKYKSQGTAGDIYQKEEGFYQTTMYTAFKEKLEDVLVAAGYGPL